MMLLRLRWYFEGVWNEVCNWLCRENQDTKG